MKVIQVTDLHLVRPGERLFDTDPLQRLEACLADIISNHTDADLCVFTGDLAHLGDAAAYAALRERLCALPMPSAIMMIERPSDGFSLTLRSMSKVSSSRASIPL